MKTVRKSVIFLLILVIVLTTAGCGVGKKAVTQYHGLIEAYQAAQKAAATSRSCLVLAFSEMNVQSTMVNNYLIADIEKTKVYRESLANYGTKFSDQNNAYFDTAGNGVQPGDLDLAELVNQGATPADMGLTLQVYASTFYEAPLQAVDSEPVINAQRIFSEKFNQAFACIKEWNDAVEDYNVERNKIPGDLIGTVANELGVKELPPELPYYIQEGSLSAPVIPTIDVGGDD